MISHREKLRFDLILTDIDIAGQKQMFDVLSSCFSEISNVDSKIFLRTLQDQEAVSSSGIGDGIVLPHVQIDAITQPMSVLIKLKKPMNYSGIDDVPVDIVCCVASPEADGPHHLRRLSRLSRLLRDSAFCGSIRKLKEAEDLQNLFLESQTQLLMAA